MQAECERSAGCGQGCPKRRLTKRKPGVEVTGTTLSLVKQGRTFEGPVLLGTAADEVCSLEGMDFSFKLSEADFEKDTHTEYDAYDINVSEVMQLYGRVGPDFHGQPNVSCGCGSPQLSAR